MVSIHDNGVIHWVTCISGFLQDAGKPNGITAIWNDLRRFSHPNRVVDHLTWRAKVSKQAEFRWRFLTKDGSKIMLIGYSWGGATALKLCRELKKRGVTVDRLVLIDAVHRHPYWLGRWRSFAKWSKLEVPSNVREVIQFRQNVNLPAGHDLVFEDEALTSFSGPIYLDVTHQFIDDHQVVRQSTLELVEDFIND